MTDAATGPASVPASQPPAPTAWAFSPGGWFAVVGTAVTAVLPPTERARAASLWQLVDEGADADDVLDALVAGGLRALPAFALVGHDPAGADGAMDEVRVVVRGPVRLTLTTGDQVVEIHGSAARTWVERTLADVSHLGVEPDDSGGSDVSDGSDGSEPAVDLRVLTGLVRVARLERGERRRPGVHARPWDPLVAPLPSDDGPGQVAPEDVPSPVAAEDLLEQLPPPPLVPPVDAPRPGFEAEPADGRQDEMPDEPLGGSHDELGEVAPLEAAALPHDGPDALDGLDGLDGLDAEVTEPVEVSPRGDEDEEPPIWVPRDRPEADDPTVGLPTVPPPPPPPPPVPGASPAGPVPAAGAEGPGDPGASERPAQGTDTDDTADTADTHDHDGMTRIGEYDPSHLAAAPPGIPGQPPAPSVTRPVARLAFSHGEHVDVDRVVLVGRAPEARRFDPREQPRLVTVPSPQQEISSTHLEIRPGSGADHGSAVVTDLGSTNGTMLVQPGLPPEELPAGVAVQLLPGAVVDLGDGVTISVTRP